MKKWKGKFVELGLLPSNCPSLTSLARWGNTILLHPRLKMSLSGSHVNGEVGFFKILGLRNVGCGRSDNNMIKVSLVMKLLTFHLVNILILYFKKVQNLATSLHMSKSWSKLVYTICQVYTSIMNSSSYNLIMNINGSWATNTWENHDLNWSTI